MSTKLSDVRAAQPEWFSRENKKFFGDVSYKVLHGKKSKKPFLVRLTKAWTGSFGGKERLHYIIDMLGDVLNIQGLIDEKFATIDDVKDWLSEN